MVSIARPLTGPRQIRRCTHASEVLLRRAFDDPAPAFGYRRISQAHTRTTLKRRDHNENHSVSIIRCGRPAGGLDDDIRTKLRQLPERLPLGDAGRCSGLGLQRAGRSLDAFPRQPPRQGDRANAQGDAFAYAGSRAITEGLQSPPKANFDRLRVTCRVDKGALLRAVPTRRGLWGARFALPTYDASIRPERTLAGTLMHPAENAGCTICPRPPARRGVSKSHNSVDPPITSRALCRPRPSRRSSCRGFGRPQGSCRSCIPPPCRPARSPGT
jgi:hypothetical protein